MVPIRNVPDALHRRLRFGPQTLADTLRLLLAELERVAARPQQALKDVHDQSWSYRSGGILQMPLRPGAIV